MIALAVAVLLSTSAMTFLLYEPVSNLVPSDGAVSAATLDDRPGQLEHLVGSSQAVMGQGVTGIALTNYRPETWLREARIYQAMARTEAGSVEVLFEITDDTVALASVATPSASLLLDPAVVLTDATVDRLDRWDHRGWMGGTGMQQADVTGRVVRTDDKDCQRFAISLTPVEASPLGEQQLNLGLCPKSGLQTFDWAGNGQTLVTLAAGNGVAPNGRRGVATPRPTTGDPAGWHTAQTQVTATDGLGRDAVTVYGQVDPAITSSGMVMVANSYGQNLTAIEVGAAGSPSPNAEMRWRAHPGGVITRVLTVGAVTIVATSQRELVAYDERGLQLWRTRVDDLVVAADVSGPRLVLVLASGHVLAVDPMSGQEAWRSQQEGRGTEHLAVLEDLIAVGDDQGNVQVLDGVDGASLIEGSGSALFGLGFAGGHLVTLRTGRIEVSDLVTNKFIWAAPVPGVDPTVATVGSTIVYGSEVGLWMVQPDGTPLAEGDPVDEVQRVGDLIITVNGTQVQALSDPGVVGPTWDLGDPVDSRISCLCAANANGLVFNLGNGLVVIR
ncbi:PQQ-binding-like beta-propeller repeat protein [Propionibacteriaceae bacterium Y1685]